MIIIWIYIKYPHVIISTILIFTSKNVYCLAICWACHATSWWHYIFIIKYKFTLNWLVILRLKNDLYRVFWRYVFKNCVCHLCIFIIIATYDINCLLILFLDYYAAKWVKFRYLLNSWRVLFGPVLCLRVEFVNVIWWVDVLVYAAD